MEVELSNMHFYFPQVATLLAIKNNKQPTEGRKKAKQNVYCFESFVRECFYVRGINSVTQARDASLLPSAPEILNKVIKTLLIP